MTSASPPLASVRRALASFALAPARPLPLAVLRIGVALVLLCQAALVAPAHVDLLGSDGLVNGAARDALRRPGVPHVDAMARCLAQLGADETRTLAVLGVVYVAAACALLVGFRTRAAAAATWLLHLTLMTAGAGTNYGLDRFAHIAMFYLLWAPAGAALSVDRALARAPAAPSAQARLVLRALQLHLCIVYLTSGVAKARVGAWHTGDVIWRALMSPTYATLGFDFSWLANHTWVAVLAGWAALLVEVGYPVLIWPRRTRRAWVAATVALHVGIAVFLGLVLFSALMIVLTIAAFGVDAEPRAASDPARERSAERPSISRARATTRQRS